MKTIKLLILLLVVNIIILSCRRNNLIDKNILDKATLANIIADIYIVSHSSEINAFNQSISSGNSNINPHTINEQLNAYELDKLYNRYNTNRFIVYKTYRYYLKDGDIEKTNKLKEIYMLASQIIADKKRELQLIINNKDNKK
ncbi:MAG: hypothetical protein ACQPRJ_03185 [Solitalea-like symbiont of Acarus siro]